MSFSPAFQARLRASAQQANLTPAEFISQFEAYISKPTNGYNNAYNFPLSRDFQESATRMECLQQLKRNLESCGFKLTASPYTKPGTFAFIKDDYSCQRDPSPIVCDLSVCTKIAIHL